VLKAILRTRGAPAAVLLHRGRRGHLHPPARRGAQGTAEHL